MDRPAWTIHTSGTGSLEYKDLREKTVGIEHEDTIYDDWDYIEGPTSLPDDALHQNVKIILSASENNPAVKSAAVAPPCISGRGRGLNPASKQIPIFVQATLKRKEGMVLGEAAVAGGGNAAWSKEAHCFADNGPFYWGDVQRTVAKAAYEKGYIHAAGVDTLSFDEANVSPLAGGIGWRQLPAELEFGRKRSLLGYDETRAAGFDSKYCGRRSPCTWFVR